MFEKSVTGNKSVIIKSSLSDTKSVDVANGVYVNVFEVQTIQHVVLQVKIALEEVILKYRLKNEGRDSSREILSERILKRFFKRKLNFAAKAGRGVR